jgi:hypothetical protein
MQLREKGRRILILRSEYVPEKKRTVARTVGSIPKGQTTLPDEVRSKLTENESADVLEQLRQRTEKQSADMARLNVRWMPREIERMAESVEHDQGAEALDEKTAHAAYAAIDRLQKALRKRGHTRPKARREQSGNQSADTPMDGLWKGEGGGLQE